ncbi:hypothetical protein GGE45_003964 [Rhizobium aethiopicum]|nr:hypothetical protein [Rhizobium aethiopicum]
MKRLVERIEHKARVGSPDFPPTDDTTSKGIDHESDLKEPPPSGHMREIKIPQHVRRAVFGSYPSAEGRLP